MSAATGVRAVVLEALVAVARAGGAGDGLDRAIDDAVARAGAAVGATRAELVAGPRAERAAREGAVLVPARAGGAGVGAITLTLPPGRRLDDDEREALDTLAHVLTLELRNSQLFDGIRERAAELDRQLRQLAALTEVARDAARWADEEEGHRAIVAQARRLVHADAAALVIAGPEGPGLAAADGDPGVARALEGLAAGAAADGPSRRAGRMAVPVPAAHGGHGPAGGIAVARADANPFAADDAERLEGLAGQAAVALSNARLLADLRREQAERRSLAAALVLAQEDERRRVAENLHDGPVQELTGLGLLLDALAAELDGESPAAGAQARRAAGSARESVRALRRAIFDLHPMALEELGFSAATRTLVERLEWRGVGVVLDLRAADVLTDTQRTVAFRIVQEAVANVIRHAEPSVVAIDARRTAGRLALEVRDDGRGFEPGLVRPGIGEGHLGLAAMAERAALVGGEVAVESAPGRGTTVRLTLPIGGAEAGPDERP